MSKTDETIAVIFDHMAAAQKNGTRADDWEMRLGILSRLRLTKQGLATDDLLRIPLRGAEAEPEILTPEQIGMRSRALRWLADQGAIGQDEDTQRWYADEVAPRVFGHPGTSPDFLTAFRGAGFREP